jgi:hypothetical protein
MPEDKKTQEHSPEPPKEVKTLFTWESPSRPFKRRDHKYFQTVGLLLLLVAAIALFIQEFLFIGVLLALFFVLYVLGTIEPESIEHKITNQGVTTAGRSYIWNELNDFWFIDKHGAVVLNVGTKIRFPGRLLMLVPYLDRDKIKQILVEYISFREAAPSTWMDETVDWFYAKLPHSLR